MTPEVAALWERALESLATAEREVAHSPNAAASRAYYAAFHAVAALFVHEGKRFRKHSGLEAAVHRDLVHAGRWTVDLGRAYSTLIELRTTADYGVMQNVSREDADGAIAAARLILEAVAAAIPGLTALQPKR